MQGSGLSLPRLGSCCLFCILFASSLAKAQTPAPQSRPQARIVAPVDESARVTLRGNTHPLAQTQFDRGAAPPDLPMARMLLVLKRSAEQEAALQKLLDDQQDLASPNYHQWLTPDQFGQQFGPSDQDMQAVEAWLRSHGFQLAPRSHGRTVIEFSGTALQVLQAFHTEIHKFTVNGEDHWANVSDPQIPAAVAPVVEGIASLHDFPMQAAHRVGGVFSKSRATGQVQAVQPGYTTSCGTSSTCYFLGPYDFATIYNVLPLWTGSPAIDGTGQSIAIIGRSNIVVQDVRDFRNLFGLLPNDPQVIIDGPDPGLVQGAETEADLDVEWSGAVAKGATIKLVTAASTSSSSGISLAVVYAVENNIAPIISESFLSCELFLGATGNSFQNGLRQQAAAQGITFINASGDEGAAGCDFFPGNTPAPATHGLMVNGLASSPYTVAVGGTDFLNFGSSYNFQSPSPYWNPTNDTHEASARGYVPETTWNSTCTNNIFVVFGYGSTPEASCNNSQAQNYVETFAGGGGKSNCITSNGSNPPVCLGGYAKPSWQSAPGVPQDSARDIPDVSMFASGGFMNSAYIVCEADRTPPVSYGSCGTTTQYAFLGVGGTSASAPAFAGIMALVNQYTKSSGQGNANYVLYKLASSQTQRNSSCNASGTPQSTCIFNDVTAGTIAVPCAANSPDCNVLNGSDTYGVLSGYSAGAGYDLATGLGSVNAYNLVHNWSPPTVKTTTTLSLNGGAAVNITHGQPVPVSITVSPSSATGDVVLLGSPTAGTSVAMGAFTVQNGAATGTTSTLAGSGTTSYQVVARYAGDATYAPSESSAVAVTVAPEPSNTLITIPVFDPTTGNETGNTPTSLVYGSPYIARMDVADTKETVTFPMKPLCAPLSCPTGSVTLSDSVGGGAATTLGVFPLNLLGYADYSSIQLGGGAHKLSASYPGDTSYGPSSGSYNLTVTPAPTQVTSPFFFQTVLISTQVSFSSTVNANVLQGATPAGTITFYDGSTLIPGTVNLSGQPGTSTAGATLTGSMSAAFTTSGPHQVTAKYSGDSNYSGQTSSPASFSVVYPTTAVETASASTINLGQSVTVTATVTGTAKTPPMTGTFQFYANPAVQVSGPPTQGMDAGGNQTLSQTVTTSPQYTESVMANYSGDSNYESANASVLVNVVLPDFNLGTSAPSLTITAGQSGITQLTLTPINNIPDSVALSCVSTQVAGATCSFNPPSPLSLTGANAATTTLSIATVPPSSSPTTTFVGFRPIPPQAWWTLATAEVLAALLLFAFAGQSRRRLAARVAFGGLVCLVLGCASGNGGGGGGGGGGGPVPTSLTLTVSSMKVQSGTAFTLTAAVHSTQSVTGTVYFSDSVAGLPSAQVVNGVATAQAILSLAGTHTITAQYSGDALNQPSQTTGSINLVITGTGQVTVFAQGKGYSHESMIGVTIQ